jgi:hypothetical protein
MCPVAKLLVLWHARVWQGSPWPTRLTCCCTIPTSGTCCDAGVASLATGVPMLAKAGAAVVTLLRREESQGTAMRRQQERQAPASRDASST